MFASAATSQAETPMTNTNLVFKGSSYGHPQLKKMKQVHASGGRDHWAYFMQDMHTLAIVPSQSGDQLDLAYRRRDDIAQLSSTNKVH